MITARNGTLRYQTIFTNGNHQAVSRQKLMQVAATCPVHKTLSKSISLESAADLRDRDSG
ncbi:MAG: hypothetical protein C4530_21310 [Desulfobacteraceae bacterium]|nr:MAG: hypothetical protein C4530_21310 [Desulfobacteraceae bacterium]